VWSCWAVWGSITELDRHIGHWTIVKATQYNIFIQTEHLAYNLKVIRYKLAYLAYQTESNTKSPIKNQDR
jgi:hypothetical protein